jgi:hypothetical protein
MLTINLNLIVQIDQRSSKHGWLVLYTILYKMNIYKFKFWLKRHFVMTSEISASGSLQKFFSFSLSSIIVKREFPQQLSQISL